MAISLRGPGDSNSKHAHDRSDSDPISHDVNKTIAPSLYTPARDLSIRNTLADDKAFIGLREDLNKIAAQELSPEPKEEGSSSAGGYHSTSSAVSEDKRTIRLVNLAITHAMIFTTLMAVLPLILFLLHGNPTSISSGLDLNHYFFLTNIVGGWVLFVYILITSPNTGPLSQPVLSRFTRRMREPLNRLALRGWFAVALEGGDVQALRYYLDLIDGLRKKVPVTDSPPETTETSITTSLISARERELWQQCRKVLRRRQESYSVKLRGRFVLVVEVLRGWLGLAVPTRISWTCGCGEDMYATIEESWPGAAQEMQIELQRSAVEAVILAGNSEFSSSEGGKEPQTNSSEASKNLRAKKAPKTSPNKLEGRSESEETPSQPATEREDQLQTGDPPIERFLLLCLSNNKTAQLAQLPVARISRDCDLFGTIAARYERFCNSYVSILSTVLPGWFWLPERLRNLHLQLPGTVDFVQFHLVPIHDKFLPHNFKPSLPPETEVIPEPLRYHYQPCPVQLERYQLPAYFLHELLKPGTHTNNYWINIIPKKLHERLPEQPGQTGWGIRINQRPNWLVFRVLAYICIFVSTVVSVIYSAVTKDVSSGFTIGAFLLGAQGLVAGTKYFELTDTGG